PPDICTGPCSFTPLRRTALKRVKVISRGQVQQVPAKRQNRGPDNSTGDG
ncbi:single-stranded DNA-binding protein, partial [Klebsiella pneumoniae]|nr:single-stranded DNA-binding protein [Klebsiella pneumoniae]